jgi:hypothetical protein
VPPWLLLVNQSPFHNNNNSLKILTRRVSLLRVAKVGDFSPGPGLNLDLLFIENFLRWNILICRTSFNSIFWAQVGLSEIKKSLKEFRPMAYLCRDLVVSKVEKCAFSVVSHFFLDSLMSLRLNISNRVSIKYLIVTCYNWKGSNSVEKCSFILYSVWVSMCRLFWSHLQQIPFHQFIFSVPVNSHNKQKGKFSLFFYIVLWT